MGGKLAIIRVCLNPAIRRSCTLYGVCMVHLTQWRPCELCHTRIPSIMGACPLAGETYGGRGAFPLEKEAADIVGLRSQVALFLGPSVRQPLVRRLSPRSGLCRHVLPRAMRCSAREEGELFPACPFVVVILDCAQLGFIFPP